MSIFDGIVCGVIVLFVGPWFSDNPLKVKWIPSHQALLRYMGEKFGLVAMLPFRSKNRQPNLTFSLFFLIQIANSRTVIDT